MIKCKSLAILFMIFFISCSQEAPKTEAQFTLNFSAIAGGETMLWAENRAIGASFARVVTNEAFEMDLVNGKWDFYLINWESSASGALTGKVKCDAIRDIELSGGEVPLDFYLANASCDNSLFAPAFLSDNAATRTGADGGEYRFPQIGFKNCDRIDSVVDSASTCNTVSGNRGNAGSMKLTLISFDENAPGEIPLPYGQLQTACYPFGALSGKVRDADISLLNFPIGNSGESPIRTVVELFSDSDCISPVGAPLDLFRGIHTPDNVPLLGALKSFSSANGYNFFVTSSSSNPFEICNPSYIEGKFSAGTGTQDDPYIICHPEEFNLIGDEYLDSNFALGRDINFRIALDIFQPGFFPCAKPTDNINPIGGLFQPGCGAFINTPATFNGEFDGRNYTISYPLLEEDSVNSMGLFRHIGPSATVRDLKISKARVEGKAKVGVLAGHNEGIIHNITITDSKARAKEHDFGDGNGPVSYLGGAVGHHHGPNANASFIHLYNSEVDGKSNVIGGVIGWNETASNLSRLSFDGDINANPNHPNVITKVGGIVGFSSSSITHSRSQGLISGRHYNTGGIVGEIYMDNSAVDLSYSHMVILSNHDTSGDFGGIIGLATSLNHTLTNSYFAGDIRTTCGDNNTCNVGSLTGDDANFAGGDLSSEFSLYYQKEIAIGLGSRGGNGSPSNLYDNSVSLPLPFRLNVGDFPRLTWEETVDNPSICITDSLSRASVSDQLAEGRATDINPIRICNPSQMLDIRPNPGLYYRLEAPVSLDSFTENNQVVTFSGEFDGKNGYLHGLSIPPTGPFAIFGDINSLGSLKNINIYNSKVDNPVLSTYGLLAKINSGEIFNTKIAGGYVSANTLAGLVAAKNDGGIIAYTEIDHHSKINIATSSGGLITGENKDGKIAYAWLSGEVTSSSSSIGYVGAVAGKNIYTSAQTSISQIEFSGRLDLTPTTSANNNIGGIVGQNAGGAIVKDIHITEHAYLFFDSATNSGGVAGINDASSYIMNSIVEALPEFSSNPVSSNGPIVGSYAGTVTPENFYLFKPGVQFTLPAIASSTPVASTTYCDIVFDAPGLTGDLTAIREIAGNKAYPIIFGGENGDFNVRIETYGDSSMTCGSLPSLEGLKFDSANTIGSIKIPFELKNYNEFCSTLPNDDEDFICNDNGWVLLYDGIEVGDYTSSAKLVQYFLNSLNQEPIEQSAPPWTFREGEGMRLTIDH